ncbi:MAG: Fe-S-binding domain-containing protein, partial [Candidatus Solibacter usitatus]|nr:Fe-S-binding domain-containing protein [Candidatus Solibacter usitatus]
MNLLTLVLFAPLAGFLAVLLLPGGNPALIRRVTLSLSLAIFAASLGLAFGAPQAVDQPWIPSLHIRFHVQLDGLSLWLVLL